VSGTTQCGYDGRRHLGARSNAGAARTHATAPTRRPTGDEKRMRDMRQRVT
jgi:hypothetical protein